MLVQASHKFPHRQYFPYLIVRLPAEQMRSSAIHVGVHQPHQPPHPPHEGEHDAAVYDQDNTQLLQVLTCETHVVPQATEDAWYAVTDDQEFIVHHRGSVQLEAAGGLTIHHV